MKQAISMRTYIGDFAENKDIAKKLRIEFIMPSLSRGDKIEIDFDGVNGSTQSFIHALISDPIREFRDVAFDNLAYKNANKDIQAVISVVYRYMQESLSGFDDSDEQ